MIYEMEELSRWQWSRLGSVQRNCVMENVSWCHARVVLNIMSTKRDDQDAQNNDHQDVILKMIKMTISAEGPAQWMGEKRTGRLPWNSRVKDLFYVMMVIVVMAMALMAMTMAAMALMAMVVMAMAVMAMPPNTEAQYRLSFTFQQMMQRINATPMYGYTQFFRLLLKTIGFGPLARGYQDQSRFICATTWDWSQCKCTMVSLK